ncbi:MAG: cyclase family protein [Planctomycetota bacterium]|jgi:arylformamidase|nr:cyclase family protein [Planctomycetota bacterium]
MKIIDISPLIDENSAVWPGDTPFSRDINCDFANGDNLRLSSFTTTTHIGAHTDAPSHYLQAGDSIADVDLSRYYGECQVIEVEVAPGCRLQPSDLSSEITAKRVLFKTGSCSDRTTFNKDFNSLSVELIEHLQQLQVLLVGIDTPSVDPFTSKKLEAHNKIATTEMAILEGIELRHVEPGIYTLCAMPLKIAHSDSSPVRAVLLDEKS